jgi:hypothetical protein
MDLPPAVLLNSIKDFCILYFKDVNHAEEAPPHFYITFPIKDDLNLIICIITSQIGSKRKYYKRTNPKAIKSLIPIDSNIFSFLDRKRGSIIECNQAELLSKEELIKRIDPNGPCEIKERKIPSYLKRDVCSAIIQSPLIAPYVKKFIKEKK